MISISFYSNYVIPITINCSQTLLPFNLSTLSVIGVGSPGHGTSDLSMNVLCFEASPVDTMTGPFPRCCTVGHFGPLLHFLANVDSCSRSLYAVARPSVCRLSVCNARAPYLGGCNFPQYFYGIWYLGHPLTSTENFTEIVPKGTPPVGELNTRGVSKYNDF